MAKDLLVVHEYEFYNVKVLVKLDRLKKTASLVEYRDNRDEYDYKEYMFNARGLAYMDGWLNVLEAMKSAIEAAKVEMKVWEDEDQQKQVELFFKLQEHEDTLRDTKTPNDSSWKSARGKGKK